MPKVILLLLSISLFSTSLQAQETPAPETDTIAYSQEEYQRQRQKEIEEMQQALTAMSKFMVQTMNRMTLAINESIPEIAKSSQDFIQSLQPIIKAAEENAQQAEQYNYPEIKPQNPFAEAQAIKEPTQEEIAPTTASPAKPKRIKLFPDPSPNY